MTCGSISGPVASLVWRQRLILPVLFCVFPFSVTLMPVFGSGAVCVCCASLGLTDMVTFSADQ